jgi:hypothetical protein
MVPPDRAGGGTLPSNDAEAEPANTVCSWPQRMAPDRTVKDASREGSAPASRSVGRGTATIRAVEWRLAGWLERGDPLRDQAAPTYLGRRT